MLLFQLTVKQIVVLFITYYWRDEIKHCESGGSFRTCVGGGGHKKFVILVGELERKNHLLDRGITS